MTIGKVTVGATTHHKVRIEQSYKTTIANPNLEPRKPQLSLDELTDVSTSNVRDGYAIVYNSATNIFEPAPVHGPAVLTNIDGGTY